MLATLLLGMMGTVSAETYIVDTWEDGDLSEWEEVERSSLGELSTTQNTPLFGNYKGFLETTGPDPHFNIWQKNTSYSIQSGDDVVIYAKTNETGQDYDTVLRMRDRSTGNYFEAMFRNGEIQPRGDNYEPWNNDDGQKSNYYSYSADTWYKFVFHKYSDGDEGFTVYDMNDNQLMDVKYDYSGGSSFDQYRLRIEGEAWTTLSFDNELLNKPPSIDSVSTDPSSWTLNSDINVSANVSDSDGAVSSVSADVWENGSQIVSDASLSQAQDGSWEATDLFSVDESDVYYNFTLTATDNDGAAAQYSDSQFIKDEVPEFDITNPANSSIYNYETPWTVEVKQDGDNVPQEDITCEIYDDGNITDTVTLKEGDSSNNTASGTLRHKNGTHVFKASCQDPGGNTKTKNVSYTIKYFEVESKSSKASVYETSDPWFYSSVKSGDMINSVRGFLKWNNSVVNVSESFTPDVSDNVDLINNDIPLVPSNKTSVDWSFVYQVNRTGFDGNTTLENRTSTVSSQDVLWSYYLTGSDTVPQNGNYIEREDLKHRVNVGTESDEASISGTTTYHRDGSTASMTKSSENSSVETWIGEIDTGEISGNSSKFNTSSDLTVSFNGDSRSLTTDKDELEVFRIQMSECSQGDPGTALKFVTYQENDRDNKTTSTLDVAWNMEKTGEVTRTFNTESSDKKEHFFCVEPSWAEYQVDSLSKLIQYTADGYVTRSYFLNNETVSNTTTTIPLYMLDESRAERISFEVTDESGNAVSEMVIRIERYFPSEDRHINVAMVRTGSEGRTETFLEVNEIYYQFKFFNQNGDLVKTEPDQTISSNLLSFRLGEEATPTYYEFKEDVNTNCQYNTTHFLCDWASETESLNKMILRAEKNERIGFETVCEVESTSKSGDLICSGLNTSSASYKLNLIGEFNDGQTVSFYNRIVGERSNPYERTGLAITLFMTLTLGIAGLRFPTMSMALSTMALVGSWFVGFFPIQLTFLMSIVLIESIAIWRVRG